MNKNQIPKDDPLLQTAFNTYQSPSPAGLKSEKNRTVFCENFVESNPFTLSTLCLKTLAENNIIKSTFLLGLNQVQLRTFYSFFNENLPIQKCINIQDDYYWKRVFCSLCKDKMIIKAKTRQPDVSWKNLSIELKYLEVLENSSYELWNLEEMDQLAKLVAPYVIELNIKKLQPMREDTFKRFQESDSSSESSVEEDEEDENENKKEEDLDVPEKKYDYPSKDCHHIDLGILTNLYNLNFLNLEIVPPPVNTNYHTRLFNCSYEDIENLARGLSGLKNLRTFKLRKTRMDSTKMYILLEALKAIFVEVLEIYFCQLEDDSGGALYDFLISTTTLKHLDLSGNYFRSEAIDLLTEALEKSEIRLAYLNLSKNRITEESLNSFCKFLEKYEHLKTLNLSAIPSPDNGVKGIIGLVKYNHDLIDLDITAVTVHGFSLNEALDKNFQLEKLSCQCCGLTIEEEFKIEIMLRRNLFKKANPYIGDVNKTEEEIFAFLKQPKHHVYIKALEKMKKRSECLQKRAKPCDSDIQVVPDDLESSCSRFTN